MPWISVSPDVDCDAYFCTIQARWVNILAASDTKMEVRGEAARGLRLNPQSLSPVAQAGATAGGGTGPGPKDEGPLPEVESLLNYAFR